MLDKYVMFLYNNYCVRKIIWRIGQEVKTQPSHG